MNRFIQAKQLNHRDELVWYVKYRGRYLKCIWRKSEEEPDELDITFVAIWMKSGIDDKGYASFEEDGVFKAFTRVGLKK